MIKTITDNNITYAQIIRASHLSAETEFYTADTDEIQFGTIKYKKNHKTGTHCHNRVDKKTTQLDEIIIVQEGSMRVDFYNNEGIYIKSSEVFKGDILIIKKGGHNILFYEDTKVISIKAGAYDKLASKTRIVGTNNLDLIIEN